MKKTGKRISKSVQKTLIASAVSATLVGPLSDSKAATESQPYQINKGDTLSQIAQSLYGNWIKFKELYEANKDVISNPNRIFPGQRIRLLDGGEIELVEGSEAAAEKRQAAASGLIDTGELVADNSAGLPVTRSLKRQGRRGASNEWQLLPKQRWETFTFKVSPLIDPNGFDRRSRVGIKYKDTLNVPSIVTTDRLAVLGQITGGRSEYSSFGLGEQVLIRADDELQVGKTYSLSQDEKTIQSHRDARVGHLYRLTGKVRIVGVRDGVFVGTITQAYEPVMRENLLIPEVPQVRLVDAIPAPSALAASIVEDESDLSQNLGGHRMIFIDVGTEDGVKAGMIFRRYQHEDPMTKKTLSAQDFLVEGEVKILSAGERFSTAVILNNRSAMLRDDELVALVDVSDLGKHLGLQSDLQNHQTGGLDELDRMDPSQGLGAQEDRELRQLENVESADLQSEIQKVEVNSTHRSAVEIGRENGPNDRSGGAPAKKSETPVPGETLPAETPAADPNAPVPGDQLNEAPPVTETPPATETPTTTESAPPVPETAPDPTVPAAPSSDPFSTDSFKGNEVQPAPAPEATGTEDPLLQAIPGN